VRLGPAGIPRSATGNACGPTCWPRSTSQHPGFGPEWSVSHHWTGWTTRSEGEFRPPTAAGGQPPSPAAQRTVKVQTRAWVISLVVGGVETSDHHMAPARPYPPSSAHITTTLRRPWHSRRAERPWRAGHADQGGDGQRDNTGSATESLAHGKPPDIVSGIQRHTQSGERSGWHGDLRPDLPWRSPPDPTARTRGAIVTHSPRQRTGLHGSVVSRLWLRIDDGPVTGR
jgi:hypothetical protein